jgi:hypothetical protein
MRDLASQLGVYLDHVVQRIDADEILEGPVVGVSPVAGADVPWVTPSVGLPRRPLWTFVAVGVTVLAIGVFPWVLPGGEDRPEPAVDLGVFEPLQGRIVVVNGNELEGIDPAYPTSPVTLGIPDLPSVPDTACLSWSSEPCDDGADSLMPVGWSLDGTVLALESEYAGVSFLMDDTGTLTRIPWEEVGTDGGCCAFVTSNWLSPDGRYAARASGLGLAIIDLERMSVESKAELDPDEFPGHEGYGQIYYQTWSPDGANVAFVAVAFEDSRERPTIQIYNRATGTVHALAGSTFGHIRNLAWSPDGSQLLVVAGDMALRAGLSLNPLTRPISTSLYLLDVDDGGSRHIASGHYVAAAWSPDGSQIAAVDYYRGRHLVVMDADGTDQQTLANMSGGLFTGVSWHPAP